MRALKSYFAPVMNEDDKAQTATSRPGEAKAAWNYKGHAGIFEKETSIELSMSRTENVDGPTAMAQVIAPGPRRLKPPISWSSWSTSPITANTPATSRPSSARQTSLFPSLSAVDSRFSLVDAKTDIMASWLHEQQMRKQFTTGQSSFEGVVLKKTRGEFTCRPPQMALHPCSLYDMAAQMNVRCAMTVNTFVVRTLLTSIRRRRPDIDHVPLSKGLRIQIIPSMTDLPRCKFHHYAAFVEDVGMMIAWDDDPAALVERVASLQEQFVVMIWGSGVSDSEDEDDILEKTGGVLTDVDEIDSETGEDGMVPEHRPVQLTSATMVAFTVALCTSTVGLGLRAIAIEIALDHDYTRLALVAVIPVQVLASLFFFQSIIANLFQIFGPTAAIATNSKYYSGKPPRRLNASACTLPHVTFQLPVYKESLESTIKPTVTSLQAAISTYEMQGGSASIFVNDDGMQLISDEKAQLRRDFYAERNIGWVARPPHCPKPEAEKGERFFLRRGKFKKASNMNYGLMISNRVEEKLATISRGPDWNQRLEDDAYAQCLADVLEECEGRAWAEGNIRIGDYIMIVDSDTRVPKDCLLDGVSEMERSPDVAIIQFASGVVNVTDSNFEKGVTWFTNLIYTAITYACAIGDACPFVGHNALLRWTAIQDGAAYVDEDGYEKFWSESHVSEDFDMALRLQVCGYSLRYAAYLQDGFKEGVSLTVYDELARWEKYAFGVTELIFNPVRLWLVRGPFHPIFRKFIWSNMGLAKKLTILAYICSYFAISGAWLITLLNYFLTGWYLGHYDRYYVDSFAIYVSVVVVFSGLGNLALAMLRYRTTDRSLIGSLFENLKWVPIFTIFIGGMSLHLAKAILCHLFEIPITWGATTKEASEVNFGSEMLTVLRKFKGTFLFCFACTGLMLAGSFAFPQMWQIRQFNSIYPLSATVIAHFALPVCLNPALMMFSW